MSIEAVTSAATSRADRAAPRAGAPWAIGLLLLAGLLGVGLIQSSTSTTGLRRGMPAPAFSLTTFDGRSVRLGELSGTPVVLNFWASWCPPCREEAPALNAVARRNEGRVVFLGINVRDREEDARRFLREFGVPYQNGPDSGGVEAAYGAFGIPYTVFIGRDGTVARTWLGPLDEQQALAFVDEIV